MIRNPSIHVSLTDLEAILDSIGISAPKQVAMQILTKSAPYAIRSRYTVTGNSITRKKAEKAIKAASLSEITVEKFNLILYQVRRSAGHRMMQPITKGSRDFILLKEVAVQAVQFCEEAEIADIYEGCKMYCTIGLQKMGRQYGLAKFKYHHAKIYAYYESCLMIQDDPKPKRTRKFHDYYSVMLLEYAGVSREMLDPETYVSFLCARMEADRAKATIEDWVTAQFEWLQRTFDSVPNPTQLFSEHALTRYYDYMAKIRKAPVETKVTLDWTETKDDFERRYAEKMRLKNGE